MRQLLERALDDKRKGVRDAATDMLARLPESDFSRRMVARLETLVAYEPPAKKLLRNRKAVLQIQLPPTPDAAAKRDGLVARARGGLGPQAAILSAIVAATPLTFWQRFGASPTDLMEAALAGDYAQALIEGWQEAAARQADPAWSEALLRRLLLIPARQAAKLDVRPDVARLLSVLQQGAIEALALDALAADPATGRNVLAECRFNWSMPLSRAALASVRAVNLRDDYAVRHWLNDTAAFYMHPSLAGEAADVWPGDLPPAAQQAVHEFTTTLRFRQDIHQELVP